MENVPNEIKDQIMKEILSRPSNQSCFDCGSPQPRWSSPYLGILICIECASRHRSYGTHISFVKSVDLDKWNKKQLKSLELTGNLYTKKKFEELGIPKIDSKYDYNSNLILEVRKDIENLVKENLKPNDYSSLKKENENNILKDGKIIENEQINNEKENLLKPIKFEIKKENFSKDKNDKKIHKKNKIKKLDIDFNFDDFKEISENKELAKNEEEKIDTKKISGMKISRKDKKKMQIEERNKKKINDETNKNKSCCEKFKEFLYNVITCFKNKNS